TLGPGATTGNTVAFTLTPSSGVTLSPSAIKFSCPGTLPAGVSCQFSSPTASPNGTVSSTLTLVLNSPLAQNSPAPLAIHHGLAYLAMMIVGGVFVAVPRKRSAIVAIMLVLLLMAMFSFGCGGSSKSKTPTAPTMTTTLTVSSATPALNSPVTLKAALSNAAGTGTVSFFDGTNLLGSAAVSNGAASLQTSSLPIGTRTLTAAYSGDAAYPAATSAPVSVDVTFTSTITAQAVDSTTGNLALQSLSLTVK
ncbi:MAG TPA: Ig-like domain-containing protein, partial [candidate division Zixibacteria bacterium]|nr:Ig-like domain-containing protein [candidate division Zixibacteria bacterium]